MKTLHIIYGLRMRGPRYGIKNSLARGELSGRFGWETGGLMAERVSEAEQS